jgi:cytochrome c oxidase subunit 1/cytochrome c oxidase subunit I+III
MRRRSSGPCPPLWEDRLPEGTGRSRLDEGLLLDQGRETLGTTALDAEPDAILKMPGDSYVPLLLTIALTAAFVAMLLHRWAALEVAALATFACTVAWLWPRAELAQTRAAPPAQGLRQAEARP